MKYHINYEGKVMPCNAKVKECPYGADRHATNEEDLYWKFQNNYNEVEIPEVLNENLEMGRKVQGYQWLTYHIERSKYPIEMLTSYYKKALEEENVNKIDPQDKQIWESSIDHVVKLRSAGYQVPIGVPMAVKDAASRRLDGKTLHNLFHLSQNQLGAKSSYEALVYRERDLKRINRFLDLHPQMTDAQAQNYHNMLKQQYNYYATLLNTRRLITQPILRIRNPEANLTNLRKIPTEDLQSLYDDVTVNDKVVEQELKQVNYFNYEYNYELSEDANYKLGEWFKSAREATKRFRLTRGQRVFMALQIAQILKERNAKFSI